MANRYQAISNRPPLATGRASGVGFTHTNARSDPMLQMGLGMSAESLEQDEAYWGQPLSRVQNIESMSMQARTNYQLPAYYIGKNLHLENLLERKILHDDYTWFFPACLGIIGTDMLHFTWETAHWKSALLSHVPEEGVSNLLQSWKEGASVSSRRYGIAYRMEHGHLNTPDGIKYYTEGMNHIASMIMATMTSIGMHRLIMQQTLLAALADSRFTSSNADILARQMLEANSRMFGAIQKPYGAEYVTGNAMQVFAERGVEPTMIIGPPNAKNLLRCREELRDYTIDAELARMHNIEPKRTIACYTADMLLPLFVYQGIPNDEGRRVNHLNRECTVGQYFTISGDEGPDGPPQEIEIIDHDCQVRRKITMLHALQHAGVFDGQNDLTPLGVALFGGNGITFRDYLNSDRVTPEVRARYMPAADAGAQAPANARAAAPKRKAATAARFTRQVDGGGFVVTHADALADDPILREVFGPFKVTDKGDTITITSTASKDFTATKHKNSSLYPIPLKGNISLTKSLASQVSVFPAENLVLQKWSTVFAVLLINDHETKTGITMDVMKEIMDRVSSNASTTASAAAAGLSGPTQGGAAAALGGAAAAGAPMQGGDWLDECICLETCRALVAQGKKLPFTVVLCRTLHFDMSAMIMMRGGSETGMMTYGHANVELGDDVKTKTAIVNYTGYLSATVFRPKNVIVLPDAIFNGYRGGGGTKLCESYDNWIREGVKMSSKASMGVMLRPVGYDVHGVVAASNYFGDSLPNFKALDETNANYDETAARVFKRAYAQAFRDVRNNYMGANGDAQGHINADGVDAHGEYNSRLRHWNSVFQQGTQWNSVMSQTGACTTCACTKKIEAQGHLKGTEDIDSASGVWAGTISMTQRVMHANIVE